MGGGGGGGGRSSAKKIRREKTSTCSLGEEVPEFAGEIEHDSCEGEDNGRPLVVYDFMSVLLVHFLRRSAEVQLNISEVQLNLGEVQLNISEVQLYSQDSIEHVILRN